MSGQGPWVADTFGRRGAGPSQPTFHQGAVMAAPRSDSFPTGRSGGGADPQRAGPQDAGASQPRAGSTPQNPRPGNFGGQDTIQPLTLPSMRPWDPTSVGSLPTISLHLGLRGPQAGLLPRKAPALRLPARLITFSPRLSPLGCAGGQVPERHQRMPFLEGATCRRVSPPAAWAGQPRLEDLRVARVSPAEQMGPPPSHRAWLAEVTQRGSGDADQGKDSP